MDVFVKRLLLLPGKEKGVGYIGSFLLSLLINLLLNFHWSIPGWVLLGLHLWLGISIWWFVGVMALWIFGIGCQMCFVGWAARCGDVKDPPKENKNPYSVRKTQR